MKKTILIPLLLIANLSFAQLKMGEKAPDFKLWLVDNNTISNNETKNKVVVFNFGLLVVLLVLQVYQRLIN